MNKQRKKQHVYALFHFPTNRILGVYSTQLGADTRLDKIIPDYNEWKEKCTEYATLEFSVQGTTVITAFEDREIIRVYK